MEKQIEEMAKLICTYPQCDNYNKIGGCKIAECQIVDKAEKIYKQGYRKQEWISVEDRLPEKHTEVLVCFDNDCVSTDFIASSGMWYDHWHKTITHWMPIPQPPKMKGAE